MRWLQFARTSSSEPLEKWKREHEESAKREQDAREALRRRDEVGVAANWDSWWAQIDSRIEQYVAHTREVMGEATGEVIGEIRADLRKEFQSALDEKFFIENFAALIKCASRYAPGRYWVGSTGAPSLRISKCSCGDVTLPVWPDLAIT
jgi:hypothetical protein